MMTPATALMFPLNVYSALMQKYVGRVPFLCFGLIPENQVLLGPALVEGDNTEDAVHLAELLIEAQERRIERLLGRLELPSGARVLDVGCGSGELARQLACRELDVTAIDNNAAAINSCLAMSVSESVPASPENDSGIHFYCADFMQFEDSKPFDLLIFNNSARYFQPMALFGKALSLLKPGGRLLICDEFVSNTQITHKPQPLPVLEHVLALSGRLHFTVHHCEDISDDTGRFQQAFARLFKLSLPQLPVLTSLPESTIRQLYQSILAETDDCLRKHRCHTLLCLEAPDVTVADSAPVAANICNASTLSATAFHKVFEASFGVAFDPALWAWKYGEGRGASVAARRADAAVAHYGGVVRNIHYFSMPARAVQICDVMVMPGERSFFSRKSLFFKTAASMLEQYVGYSADNLLGFGFPNIKAMHVAERLKLYEKTDELAQLALSAEAAASDQTAWQIELADFNEQLQGEAAGLWQQMLPAFNDAIIGVRDSGYLHYRFVQRPGLHYECLRLTENGQVKALAFRRPHGEGHLLMDVIAAPDDLPVAIYSVLRAAAPGQPCVFWLARGQLARIQLQLSGDPVSSVFQISNTGIHIPCNRWSRGPEAEVLKGKWWLTAGDMDFL